MSARRVGLVSSRRGWVAFGLPPTAWMSQLLLLYLLVPVACERGRMPLVVITVVSLVVALGAIIRSRPSHGRTGGAALPTVADVGRIQGGMFVFAILLTGAAGLWIDPCA